MKSLRIAAVVAAACAAAPLLAQAPMREGNWDVTMTMEMPNMPVKMPEIKATRCITKADIDNPSNLASAPGMNNSCKVTDQKTEGNKITWKMTCTGQMAMTGDGELVFDGDTYKGTINSTTDQGKMTMKLAGKRIGAC